MRVRMAQWPLRGGGFEMTTSTEERKDQILSRLYASGHVRVKDLSDELGVSEATVRRDLHALAEEHKIDLVYGGATVRRNAEFSFRAKAMRNVEAKRIVGELAARMVADGDSIFLDSGTTCFAMAAHLKQRRELAIIANSSGLAMEFETPGISVIMLGGVYRPDRMDTVGAMAMNSLEMLRGYTAFIGADGLSMDFGLTASDIESAHLYGVAVKNAQKTVLVADHEKFASPSLYKIVGFEGISRVVTDVRPGPEWMEFLGARGIEVTYPSTPPGDAARADQPTKQEQVDA